jgi:tetratricopeptide (TPR) repeat protein
MELGLHPALKFLTTLLESEPEIRSQELLDLASTHCTLPLKDFGAIPYIEREMSRQEDTIDSFMQLYRDFKFKGCVLHYGQEKHRSVIMTFLLWEMTMARMRRNDNREQVAIATQILNLIAFFEPDTFIKDEIFFDLKDKTDPFSTPQAKKLGQTSVATGSDFVELVLNSFDLLRKYSLVTGWRIPEWIDLQVQRLARLSLSDPETEDILYRGFALLQKYFTKEYRDHELTKLLVPHARALWNHELTHNNSKKNKMAFCHFPSLICETLVYDKEYDLALQVSKEAAAALEYAAFEENTIQRIIREYIQQIRDSEPSVLKDLHEFTRELLPISIEIYEDCVKILGAKHLLSLALDNLIALKLEVLENYTDAITRFEKVITVTKSANVNVIGTNLNDSDIVNVKLCAQFGVARILGKSGKVIEASELIESVYEEIKSIRLFTN